VIHPEPDVSGYNEWKSEITADFELQKTFRKDGLQVIVKLASIELTPEKPEYPGGNFHLEGMTNERICATAIYYYDVENITDARITFRAEAFLDDMEMQYEQNDHVPLQIIFGTDSMSQEPAVQTLGSVVTKGGRMIAFPNTLQHKVEPFSLIDKTKPGHRRFLVLWLVDPHYRVMSTANVPPQQHEWWTNEIYKLGWKLPPELTKMVTDNSDSLMRMDEAKEHRLKLMDERVKFVSAVEGNFEEYFLCEH
jgi:Protein of unknown function (DUF4246)